MIAICRLCLKDTTKSVEETPDDSSTNKTQIRLLLPEIVSINTYTTPSLLPIIYFLGFKCNVHICIV